MPATLCRTARCSFVAVVDPAIDREHRDANVVDVMTACTLAAAVRGRKQGAVRGANAVPRVTTPADGVTTLTVWLQFCALDLEVSIKRMGVVVNSSSH